MRTSSKKFFANVMARILLASGLVRLARRKAMKGNYILSIYFHQPSRAQFESCIRWLQEKGFSFLVPQDLVAIANKQIEFPRGAVIITVDDGWASNLDNVVCVAERMKVPVTIFIATEPVVNGVFWWSYIHSAKNVGAIIPSVEKMKRFKNDLRLSIVNEIKGWMRLPREAMSVKQIQELARHPYITLGSHTVNHPLLSTCSTESAIREIKDSKKNIEAWTGNQIEYFAFPSGDYTSREVEMLKISGYELAFSTNKEYLTPKRVEDKFTLPRFEIFEHTSFAESICRMTGVWFLKSRLLSN